MPLSKPEERVLLMAPVGRDAKAMAELLEELGLLTKICESPSECARSIAEGAGVMLLTEEALGLAGIETFLETLQQQPPWSELPLIILTSGGESRINRLLDISVTAAGTITLLERPMSATTLWRSVEVALRSRRRQYQVRDLIQMQAKLAVDLEKTVADRTAELRATNEHLEAFVYSIAHDLRAPLRSMTHFPEMLVAEHSAGLSDTAREMLKRIQRASQFMDKLLVDLLAYGRAARGEISLTPVPVQRAWKNALAQCAGEIDERHALIETVTPLPAVEAHEPTLGQCLTNLLGNAIKFVPPEIQPHVRFSSEPHDDFIRLWVEDNGIGIPADQHERIFNVFERVHGGRYPGTGIGLSIVRKGIERMGGHVGVQSASGKGARFWIDLRSAN